MLRAFLSLIVIGTAVFGTITGLTDNYGLPFIVNISDAHHATLKPFKGIALPPGLTAGDRLDPEQQPRGTRIAIMRFTSNSILPKNHTYDFVIARGGGTVTVPVTTVNALQTAQLRLYIWIGLLANTGLSVLALLILWWGRDRVALGMAILTLSYVFADFGITLYPTDGVMGVILLIAAGCMFLFGRIGFYVMADAMARSMLGSRTRKAFLTVFLLMLLAGATLYQIGGPLFYIYLGWAGSNVFLGGLVWSAVYLVPVAMLLACYRKAPTAQRLRLRWMLIGSVVFIFGVAMANTTIFGIGGYVLNVSCMLLGSAGFLYAVLRHRVVDVSIIIDRTLVYGATATVVIGVISAVEALVQDAALGKNASLALQAGVSLGLGIALVALHKRFDAWVERLLFRRRHKAGQALRDFAEECAFIEQESSLLDRTIHVLKQHTRAPGAVLYERTEAGYTATRQLPEGHYPHSIDVDDPVPVALRAGRSEAGLLESGSRLGNDGFAFPMTVRGDLLGFVVLAHRPSERYTKEERSLLAHVTHEAGIALFAARARSQAAFLREAAGDNALPEPWRVRARKLILGAREA